MLRIVLKQIDEELNKVHRVSLRTSILLVTMNSDNKDHPQLGKNSNRQPNAKYNVLESEKPFLKLRLISSLKLVFRYVVKRIKIKMTAKFRASRRLRF